MQQPNSEFFNLKPVDETLKQLLALIPSNTQAETIPTYAALGRIIAEAPVSPVNLPTFIRSTMDGYAVRAEDTFGASQSLPAYLTLTESVAMGTPPAHTVNSGEAAPIHTGGMLPQGANAVVMIERTQTIDENEVEILAPVAVGENVVQIGEDISEGTPILPVGHTIRPQDIGGLLAVGVTKVTVKRPITIAIMGSGDEIVSPETTPNYGQIRDINTYTLAALIQQTGATVHIAGIATDTYEAISHKAQEAIQQADMLVMTAGSSVSTRDYTRATIDALGKPGIIQHGIAVKPGKPAIIAVCDDKPVIGLPGNPVSAMLVARQLVIPTVRHLMGQTLQPTPTIRATLSANIASQSGRVDTVPVKLTEQDGKFIAEPVFGKSNLIYTLVNANGLITVDMNVGGLKAGTTVDVTPF